MKPVFIIFKYFSKKMYFKKNISDYDLMVDVDEVNIVDRLVFTESSCNKFLEFFDILHNGPWKSISISSNVFPFVSGNTKKNKTRPNNVMPAYK